MNKGLTIITGANSGNGLATAKKLNNEGYKLLLLDIDDSVMRKEVIGDNIAYGIADVTNYEQLETEITKGEEKLGPLVNIINNAGIMILEKADLQPVSQIDAMININIKGVIYGTQIALKSMKKNNTKGTIISLSSIAGIKGFPNHSTYCATKYAVRGYMETVRSEVAAEGIRVGILSPGVVKTALLDGTTNNDIKKGYETWRDEAEAFMQPEDMANAIFYMLSQPQGVDIREVVVGPTTQVE